MNQEKIIKYFLFVSLIISIVVPISILILVEDKAKAGQIGDTLGGTTAPFINLAAILVVMITYLNQKKNDRRRGERELINSLYQNLKEEVLKVGFSSTTNSDGIKETQFFSGTDAIRETIRRLNNNIVSLEDVIQYVHYNSMINVYRYFASLLQTVVENQTFSSNEKILVLSQLSLYYRNNLFIHEEQRGDAICKKHGKLHKIPSVLYDEIQKIEKKII